MLPHDKVSSDLEAEPARGHAGRYFEQVGYDAFVQAPKALCFKDGFDGVADSRVLVAHAGHGVDLESSAEDVERICAGLCNGAGNSACR